LLLIFILFLLIFFFFFNLFGLFTFALQGQFGELIRLTAALEADCLFAETWLGLWLALLLNMR
jgi:hypothetical protein